MTCISIVSATDDFVNQKKYIQVVMQKWHEATLTFQCHSSTPHSVNVAHKGDNRHDICIQKYVSFGRSHLLKLINCNLSMDK